MTCKRPGCKGKGRPLFCSAKCASKTGWAKVNGHGRKAVKAPGKPVAATGGSWWLNGATFYEIARARFPETGAAIVERGKVAITAKDSNGGRERRTA